MISIGGPEILILLVVLGVGAVVVGGVVLFLVMTRKRKGVERVSGRLEELEKLRRDGVISEDDCERRRAAILRGK